MNNYYQGATKKPAPAQRRVFRIRYPDCNIDQLKVAPFYLVRWRHYDQQQDFHLQQLLQATPNYNRLGHQLVVLPRSGFQTAWSSKVLNIVSLCQIDQVAMIEQGYIWSFVSTEQQQLLGSACWDAMTQDKYDEPPEVDAFFARPAAKPLAMIEQCHIGQYSVKQGLGLEQADIGYLRHIYQGANRSATDAELMMFAQINSEHCRHRIFTGEWKIDSKLCDGSLFDAIKATTAANPVGVLSAYSDNAAVIEGWQGQQLQTDDLGKYYYQEQLIHHCIKVETHNHPTAIAPWEGAATGIGGEIRDEGATGSGAQPKAGISGFIVGDLRIPSLPQPWERERSMPNHASPLDIMVFGPLGSNNYGNEFGRPSVSGFFRTVDIDHHQRRYANLKPVMIAGGIGSITDANALKHPITSDCLLIVLGGASMRIGIGGGSTSSMLSGSNNRDLDFSSVQRDNPEMERRCQQVIDYCSQRQSNPIAFIHDIGAGGLANAFPELAHQSGLGASINLDHVPCDDASLSPMEIWCNESQERYALAIEKNQLQLFTSICERERCPFAVIGTTTKEQQLVVRAGDVRVVDMSMQAIFSDLPQLTMDYQQHQPATPIDAIDYQQPLASALTRLLQCPSVASKEFLITIADRSISGLVAGESMIGPWQVPVSDCALTATSYGDYQGEAMAIGERTPLAITDASASVRIALGELITNLVSCGDVCLERVNISANWMAACKQPEQRQALHQGVLAFSKACQQLGLAVPVGKDSLSMESCWQDDQGKQHSAISPMSAILTGYCRVKDVRKRLTPQLVPEDNSTLYFIDLAAGKQRLGWSALAQTQQCTGGETPDIESCSMLADFVDFVTEMSRQQSVLAYHDRSDGGLWACFCEMAFAGHLGLTLDITALGDNPLAILANEELGAVLQVHDVDRARFEQAGQKLTMHAVGRITSDNQIRVVHKGTTIFVDSTSNLESIWTKTSHHLESIRDDTTTSQQSHYRIADWQRSYLVNRPAYQPETLQAPAIVLTQPRIAILREQGTNGHKEMAAAFYEAGFQPVDIHMSDLASEKMQLTGFQGLVACGGFSYGDVLGAATGWAKVILHNQQLRDIFSTFFYRDNTFSLGVCNGCQMLSQLADIIPGVDSFPQFVSNQSGRFEGRLVNLSIEESSSVLFEGMAGSVLTTAIAHGYGKLVHNQQPSYQITTRYSDHQGQQATSYPDNPNGSDHAIAGLCTHDGRVTLIMPHPERNFLNHQSGWQHPHSSPWHHRYGPWFRVFTNARKFCV